MEASQFFEFNKQKVYCDQRCPSGKPAKLHTVAANNNRDHPMRSFYCCLFAPHTNRCYS